MTALMNTWKKVRMTRIRVWRIGPYLVDWIMFRRYPIRLLPFCRDSHGYAWRISAGLGIGFIGIGRTQPLIRARTKGESNAK